MLCRIALRNVKRQLSNYVIYFITVTVTVAMMFALCSLIYSKELLFYADNVSELKSALIGISVMVAIIVSFVLGYANSFMLKFRKKEFGTYLTLGMSRKNILSLFIVENMIIGLAAMGFGIIIGLVIFQAMTGIIAKVLELDVTFGSYSIKGLNMTIGLCGAMFIMATLISARYLRKTSIHELLHSQKNLDKPVKHPLIHFILAILALTTIIMSFIQINSYIIKMYKESDDSAMGIVLLWALALLVAVVIYHIALCKSIMFFLLKSTKIKSRGTNTFVFRQLSSQLGTNSVLCGMLALLITLAVIGTNISFGEKTTIDEYIKKYYPFDIVVNRTENKNAPFTYKESLKTIEKYSQIDTEIKYNIYTSGENTLHKCTMWYGEGYEGLTDSFIKLSDFNRLIKQLNYNEIELDISYVILANETQVMGCDFDSVELSLGNNKYSCSYVTDKFPEFARNGYFLCVVPDEAVEDMNIECEYSAINLADSDYDANALDKELTYICNENGFNISMCNYAIKEYALHEENAVAAMLIICTLYLAVIFVFMAVAILSMKLLSGISEDRMRYKLLGHIGTDYLDRKKTLFRQIFGFFTVPFLLPVLLSVPTAIVCCEIVSNQGYYSLVAEVYKNSAVIALIMMFTQYLYFTACYYIEKKRVL